MIDMNVDHRGIVRWVVVVMFTPRWPVPAHPRQAIEYIYPSLDDKLRGRQAASVYCVALDGCA